MRRDREFVSTKVETRLSHAPGYRNQYEAVGKQLINKIVMIKDPIFKHVFTIWEESINRVTKQKIELPSKT